MDWTDRRSVHGRHGRGMPEDAVVAVCAVREEPASDSAGYFPAWEVGCIRGYMQVSATSVC